MVGLRAALPRAGLRAHPPRPRAGSRWRAARAIHFVTQGFEAAYAQARETAGEDGIDIAGGASTVRQALAAGVIDELTLDVAPVLLGSGERLFDGVESLGFEPVEVLHSPLATHMLLPAGRVSEEIAALWNSEHASRTLGAAKAELDAPEVLHRWFRPRRAQPVSGQADVSYGRTVCLDVGGVDPTHPTARDMHPDYRDASRAQVPIARSISSTVSAPPARRHR